MNTAITKDSELVTAFDLNNSEIDKKPVYQFVYASQLYGTLFGIYGRFNTTKIGNECKVHNLTLSLLNYQGVINIGFTPDETYSPPFYDPSDKESDIYFGVIGLSTLRCKPIPIEPELIIKKGECFKFTFKRILYPLEGFNSNQTEETDFGHPHGDVPNTPYFDTEFHTRSGVDYFRNPLRPGMAGFDTLTLESLRKSPLVASPRCTQSIVNLYY